MKISVIIPTYNRAEFLANTIESVLNQTVEADEIIVVDDGSDDKTKGVVEQYPLKYIYQKNSGVSSARNRGIREASNDFICFLDSDDIWERNKLEVQIEFHKTNPNILLSYTDEIWFFNTKEIKQNKNQKKGQNSFLDNLSLCKIGASTVMLHKSIFDKVDLFDESLKVCEDYDLWLRILRKFEIGYIDIPLIRKIAGHKGQLSFETIGMDYYRILALKKHSQSEYSLEIKKEIEKKKQILLKGAIKHDNKFYIDFCKNL